MTSKNRKKSKAKRSVKNLFSTQATSSSQSADFVLWTQVKLHWQLGEWTELVALTDSIAKVFVRRV